MAKELGSPPVPPARPNSATNNIVQGVGAKAAASMRAWTPGDMQHSNSPCKGTTVPLTTAIPSSEQLPPEFFLGVVDGCP